MTRTLHQSVLTNEVVKFLSPHGKGVYLDATFGGGGHSRAILEAATPGGKVVALDYDPSVIKVAEEFAKDYPGRFRFESLSYSEVDKLGCQFDGAVFDLGISTDQLSSSLEGNGRGFSFNRDEPLDMRFNPTCGKTAAEILRLSGFRELVRIFQDYAQDRYAKGLARRIIERRRITPIRTTSDFISTVGTADPSVLAPLFQALRIVVNNEIDTLIKGLNKVGQCLKEGAVLAVISFHSVEDRAVKEFFRRNSARFNLLTKKPVVPSLEEQQRNPSSRSAKLRVGQKIVG